MKRLVLGALILGCVASAASQTKRSEAVDLFRQVSPAAARSAAERSSTASRREAEIVFEQAASRAASIETFAISLFDGRTYSARRTESETRALDDTTWRGKITAGKFEGDVILTFRKGYVAGLIYSPEGVYEIMPRGDKHLLVEIDQSLFPECGGGIEGDPAIAPRDAPSATTDSGDRIDVLIVYTAAVRNFFGGDAQTQAFAQQAIDSTNTAYINSRINQRVRLAGARFTALTETGNFNTELSNLRASTEVAGFRNETRADLAAMLTTSTAACGIGYLMGAQGGNQNNGFTVTARSCAVGNLSFAHELGHNMGSHHNPENGGTATYPYSYGHWVNGNYRTVMSYVDPCTNGCARVAHFSNPHIFYNGVQTGLPTRDNARSINNTADWIANYRYSGSNIMLGVLNTPEIVYRGTTRTITWSSDNVTGPVNIEISRDEGRTWMTLVENTPNDGSEVIRFRGGPTRYARLRVSSVADPLVRDTSSVNFSLR